MSTKSYIIYITYLTGGYLMPINKNKHTSVLVNFPDHLIEKIETYQHQNKIKSRTKAIIKLTEKALQKEQSE